MLTSSKLTLQEQLDIKLKTTCDSSSSSSSSTSTASENNTDIGSSNNNEFSDSSSSNTSSSDTGSSDTSSSDTSSSNTSFNVAGSINGGSYQITCPAAGFYRESSNCQIFYHCTAAGAVISGHCCYPGLYFDLISKTCNWANLVTDCSA